MKAYLVLQNGRIFEGEAFGAVGDTIGELVFTTGVVGYIETLTDPSYYGQIVMQTFPSIGNYGIIEKDFEGACCVRGYVVREWCDTPSNFRCEYDIDEFLKKQKVTAICGVDTREITRIIRECGVMNAKICYEKPEGFDDIAAYKIEGALEAVMKYRDEKPVIYPADGEEKYKISLVDYGVKHHIIRELQKRGCTVTDYPASASAEEIMSSTPDGIVLSNGPGDPSECVYQIDEIKKLLGKLPVFGICLGHQLLALAAGGRCEKLKYGHRGANQPASMVGSERTYITSQNHGYAVCADSVKCAEVSFVNANDYTCEGLNYTGLSAMSVQFHPEACSGPHDTSFLFDRFLSLIGGKK